jgi:hypothetical protein
VQRQHIPHIDRGIIMVMPNLLHPVNIQIEKWVIAGTIYDDDVREPIKQSKRNMVFTVPGQVSWDSEDLVIVDAAGTRLNASGYVLFRYVDLNRVSLILDHQDCIKKIGWHDVNVYIIKLEPVGHYSDQNGASMVKAFFSDRVPSRGV